MKDAARDFRVVTTSTLGRRRVDPVEPPPCLCPDPAIAADYRTRAEAGMNLYQLGVGVHPLRRGLTPLGGLIFVATVAVPAKKQP
jgi:hypothetical protein